MTERPHTEDEEVGSGGPPDWPHIEIPTDENGESYPCVVIDPRTGKPYRGLSLDELADLAQHDKRLTAEASDGKREDNDEE